MDETTTNESARADTLPSGFTIAGRYKILKSLGSGGMAAVYLARDQVLSGEKVAIKILRAEYVIDERHTRRFLREVQLMRKINHPNVVRTYDVGADNDLIYFTMEYLIGKSFEDLLDSKTFPFERIADITCSICEGLNAIHQAQIIHRDLKPGNLMLLDDGNVKIADFGVARPKRSRLTAHNEVVGSATYMAPEVWLGKKPSPSIDLYSLGIILYELTTGDVPFDADSPADMMRMHLDCEPKPPKEINKNTPPWVNRLILELLAKTPSERPANAQEVITLIKQYTGRGLSFQQSEQQNGLASSEANSLVSALEQISREQLRCNPSTVADEVSDQRTTHSNRRSLRLKRVSSAFRWRSIGARCSEQINISATVFLATILLLTGFSWLLQTLYPASFIAANTTVSFNTASFGAILFSVLPAISVSAGVLAIPPTVLASLSRSFQFAVKSFLMSAGFFAFVQIALLYQHIYRGLTSSTIDTEAIFSAVQAAEQQALELLTLAPRSSYAIYEAGENTLRVALPGQIAVSSSMTGGLLWAACFLMTSLICVRIARTSALPVWCGGLLFFAGFAATLSLLAIMALDFFGSTLSLHLFGILLKLPAEVASAGGLIWGVLVTCGTLCSVFARSQRE